MNNSDQEGELDTRSVLLALISLHVRSYSTRFVRLLQDKKLRLSLGACLTCTCLHAP